MDMKPTITKLPILTPENLKELMKERLAATKNCETSIPMLWQGLLELPLSVEGESRSAFYYIPEGTPQGTAMVILNIPEGREMLPFLEESGWLALAELEGFCLFLLAPGENGWKTTAEEAVYVRAAVNEAKMGRYLLAAFSPYIVSYGRIGNLLQRAAMEDPLHTAAAVFVGKGSLNAEYLAEFETKDYCVPDSFDPHALPLQVPYREIPTPVWILSEEDDQAEAMLTYWKRAARAGEKKEDPVLGTVFQQASQSDYTETDDLVTIAIQPNAGDYCEAEVTKKIYNFLKRYYRYGMGPLSNTISRRIDPETIGAVRRSFTDSNGFKREYLVYVPATYRDGKTKLPTILAFHGASQSMRNMFSNGRWYEIADREGLIIVYPESTLLPIPNELSRSKAFAYRPLWMFSSKEAPRADAVYVNELLDQIISEFPVDEKRIYSNGHSMGCMMSNYLGSDITGNRLAAIGATSGCLRVREYGANGPVPAFLTIGQFDMWSYRLQDEGPVADSLDMWLVQDGLSTEKNVNELRTHPTTAYQAGRWNNYVWKDESGTPWLRFAWISGKHHVHTYEENRIFWEQWFSHWSIGEDGRRYYH